MSCININFIKPIANKYGVSTEDILSATYLYQLKYNTEEFNENDPQYDEFIRDFFKIDKNINVENKEQFEKLLNAWNNYTTNGITRIKNKESKDSIISFLATAFGEGNIATYSDNDGNMFVRIAQPTLNGYTKEMLDIKEKAQKDGTFMKAPNGKPTNLTKKQWLQVRTKAFKEWFGDWENIAPKLQVSDDKKLQDILQNIANSKSRFSTLAQFILDNHLSPRDLGNILIDNDFPFANQQGWYKEEDDYLVGTIRYIGFQANNAPKETFNGAILHEIMHSLTQRLLKNYKNNPNSVPDNIRASIKDLYDIIDYAKKYIQDNYNIKEDSNRQKLINLVNRQNFDKGYLHKMFYAFDETSNPESEHIDEFISEIFTNPAFQEMLNSIPYKETKKTLWDKIKECIQNIFGIPINKGSVLEESLKASTEFITKAKNEYESVSKVVDENGEPLMVYHGSSNKFNTFRNDVAIYTSPDENVANSYWFQQLSLDDFLSQEAKESVYEGTDTPSLFLESSKNNMQAYLETSKPNAEIYVWHKDLMRNKLEWENKIENVFKPFLKQEYPNLNIETLDEEQIDKISWDFADYENKTGKYKKEIQISLNDGLNYNLFENVKNPLIIDANNSNWNDIKFNNTVVSTRDIEEYAFENNYDGVIIKNVIDYGSGLSNKPATVIIAYNPNQIKSATDNNGRFSKEDDNIYEHRSNINKAFNIVEEAREELSKSYPDERSLKIAVNKFNERLSAVLSPEIKVAAGYNGMREGTQRLSLLQDIADLEKPSTREELNSLFATLSNKFSKPFKVVRGNGLHVSDKGAYYEVQVNYGELPSYTQLAEEMLHPLVEEIQKTNPELFKNFLDEVNSTKDKKLKVIRDGIYRAYKNKSVGEQYNEVVTQALAYELKNADNNKSSAFKKLISKIVNWLVEHGLLSKAPQNFKLSHLAYILKFENVKFNLSQMEHTYEHKNQTQGKNISYYEGKITPDKNTIFVFGSNPEGRHGAGAAKIAVEQFGAKYGQGEGLQGNSYALPTKDLRVKENGSYRSISPEDITKNIKKMYEVARQNPDKQFKVSHYPLGRTTLNGYSGEEMLQMFKNAGPVPTNVIFNKEWVDNWDNVPISQQIENIKQYCIDTFKSEEVKDDKGNTKHVYSLKKDPNVKSETSASTLTLNANNEFVTADKVIPKQPYGLASTTLGSTIDTLVRDFFSSNMKKSYPNLTDDQVTNLKNQLKAVQLWAANNGNYTITNANFPMLAEMTVNGRKMLVGGEMDLIAYNSEGDIMIIDIKNKRANATKTQAERLGRTEKDLEDEYKAQQNAYKIMFESITGLKVKSLKILQFKCKYPAGFHEKLNPSGKYTWTADSNKQLYYGETKLQDLSETEFANDYSAPELVLYDEKTGIKESTNTNKDGIYTVSNIDVLNTIVEEVAKETKEFGDTEKVKRDLKNTANNENKVEYKVNKIDEQTSNLRESGIKNTDLHKLACNVINALSDIYDNINKSSGLYCKVFNIDYNKLTEEEKKEVKRKFENIKELDREDLFKQIPVSQVLNYIKEAFFNPALYNEDNENYNTFLSCYNNFDALVRLGYSRMILLEKRTLNKEAIDPEDVRQDGIQDDFKADTEEVSNKDLEHWMIEQASVKSSLSGEWRRIIAKTRKVDKEGKQIYDKFGFPEFVDENVAINNLLNWFRECTTLQQMLDVLDQKIKYYPEYAAIRNMLNNNEQLKSKFFQNFRKDFQQYSIVIVNIDDDGVRTATIKNINLCSATEYMLSNLGYKFAVGFDFTKDVKNEKAIFNETYKKVIKDGKEITVTERSVNKGRISEIKSILSTFSREAENLNEKNIDEITKKFEDILSIFGIVFPENTVKQALEAELNNKTNTSFSKTLVSDVISELGYMLTQKIEKLEPHEPYSVFKEGPKIGEISIRENYVKILRKFEPFLENVVEASSYENGKMHYAFNPPSYTGKMMIKFKQAISNPTEFDNFLKNEYCKYYFVTDENVSRAKDAQFLCPILKMMNEYETNQIGAKTLTTNAINARKWFEHKVQLSYNKTAYTELGGLTYTHSILSEFFVSNDSDNDIVKAFYRMPIEANKPAFEFLSMPRFKGSNYKKVLGKYYFDVFTQELMRIRTVLERACSVDNNGKSNLEEIKNYDITKKQKESAEVKTILEKFKNKQSLTWKDLKVLSNTGASFKFLSFLNNLDVNTDNSKSNLQKYILDFIKYDVDVNSISAASNDFQNVLEDSMKTIVKNQIDYFDKLGLFEQAKTYDKYVFGEKVEGKPYYKYFTFLKLPLNTPLEEQREKINKQLENFVWNDMLAAINTIELTATDLAYYKNMEDFQKRFAQIHAPGLRLNTAAQAMLYDGTKDGNGKLRKVMQPVSDGKSRTMYIKDDEKESTGIEKKVVTAFNKLIENQPERADSLRTMRDVVKAALKKVNVADAQAYTSPTGMMKKLTMAGSWTNDMTKAYYKICSGNFNLNDLKVLIQPLKPFVYSQIDKHSYAKTLKTLKVGLQNKNSEYMILLADAIMRGAGVNNKLMALFDFMEGSAYNGRQVVRNGKLYTYNRTKTGVEVTIKDAGVGQKDGTIVTIGEYKNDGIDTIQFESAVKVGSEGIINLNNKDYDGIIKELASKTQSAIGDNYDDRYVHTFNYEDYAVQQEVPAHFKDHRQLLGSQERILNVSDMPLDTQMYFTTYDNEQLTTAGSIAKRYQQLLADNIKDSFDELAEVLGLNILDKYERNKKLSELLVQEMQKDARYGADLQIACMINKKTGEFNIPLSDPIQATRIQQLIHSIIKSRINKQKIAGGPVVQTSCWGMAERFNIVWKDSSGNTITLKSFKKNNKDELANLTEDEIQEKFEKYIESNAAILAHFECAAPVPTKELEKDLIKLAKKLDGDDYNGRLATPQEAVDNGLITEEQLQAIGYRIPTEDKYSMYPMIIKEWVPRAAGEVIILPEEITKLTGSDFDIDKTYIIAPEFKRTSITKVKEDYLDIVARIVANKLSSIKDEDGKDTSVDIETAKTLIHNWEIDNSKSPLVDSILKSQPKNIFEETDVTYVKIKEVVKNQDENNSKTVRNNEIFDIQWKMLTHQNTVDKMFNPGSFDVQKRTALMVQILKSPNVDKNEDYDSLNKLSLEQLEDKLKELNAANDNNICYISTQVMFFQQNMTAGKLIGIFANNNVSHAFIQLQNKDEHDNEKSIRMNFDPDLNLSFDDIPLGTNMVLDRIHALDGKTYISKNIAGFLAASVDAVKDPVLNHLNLNTFTSGVAMVLARLGFDVDSIGLFLSQPILVEAASRFANKNNEGYATASEIVEELLRDLDENGQLTDLNKQIAGNELTKEKMSKNLIDNNRSYNKEVLRFFYNLLPYTQALGDLTFLTKFNSMSNAAGPTIADNIIMTKRHTRFEGLFDSQKQIKVFNERTKAILDKDNSPLLNAFYKYTVAPEGAVEQAFKPWFIQYSKTFGRILKRWEETTKAPIDEKTINQLVFDFMLYKLTSGDNPFFDTSVKNRKRFIYNFPNEFFETLNKYPELENNELIKVINLKTETKTCPIRTLEVNSGGFAADTQENIKNAWSDLLNSDNVEIQKLGKDLFFYCLYRNGFGFSPKTFIHLASVDVKLGMGYTTLIETMVDEMANNSDEEIDIDEFIEQFKRNRHDNYKAVSRFKLKDLKKESSRLDVHRWDSYLEIKKLSDNKNSFSQFLTDDNKIVPIIKVDKQLYKINLSKSNVETILIYEPISPLGNTNNFLEYQAPSENKTNSGKIVSVINEKVDEETPVEQDGGFTSNTPGKEADAGKTQPNVNSEDLNDANNSNSANETANAVGATDSEKAKAKDIQSDQC